MNSITFIIRSSNESKEASDGSENSSSGHERKEKTNPAKRKREFVDSEIRKLRSSTKRKLIDSNDLKKKCHLCREKRESPKIITCANFESCHHAFCYGCIERHFRNEAKKDHIRMLSSRWICFVCRGMCHCEKCSLSLVKELSLLNDQKGCEGLYPIINPASHGPQNKNKGNLQFKKILVLTSEIKDNVQINSEAHLNEGAIATPVLPVNEQSKSMYYPYLYPGMYMKESQFYQSQAEVYDNNKVCSFQPEVVTQRLPTVSVTDIQNKTLDNHI